MNTICKLQVKSVVTFYLVMMKFFFFFPKFEWHHRPRRFSTSSVLWAVRGLPWKPFFFFLSVEHQTAWGCVRVISPYSAEPKWFMYLSFLICWNKVSMFLFHCTSQAYRDTEIRTGTLSLKKTPKSKRQFVQPHILFLFAVKVLWYSGRHHFGDETLILYISIWDFINW